MNLNIIDTHTYKDKTNNEGIKYNLSELLNFLDSLISDFEKLDYSASLVTKVYKETLRTFLNSKQKIKYEDFRNYMHENFLQYLFTLFNNFEANIINKIYNDVFDDIQQGNNAVSVFKEFMNGYFIDKELLLKNLNEDNIKTKYKNYVPLNRKIRFLYGNVNEKFNGDIQKKLELLSQMRNHLYHSNKSVELTEEQRQLFKLFLSNNWNEYAEALFNVSINKHNHFCTCTNFSNYQIFIKFFVDVFVEILSDLKQYYQNS